MAHAWTNCVGPDEPLRRTSFDGTGASGRAATIPNSSAHKRHEPLALVRVEECLPDENRARGRSPEMNPNRQFNLFLMKHRPLTTMEGVWQQIPRVQLATLLQGFLRGKSWTVVTMPLAPP